MWKSRRSRPGRAPKIDLKKQMKKKLPSKVISWLGIFGGALTIVGNLESVLTLSGWARLLVSNWSVWMTAFWTGLLSLFGAGAPSQAVSPAPTGPENVSSKP